MEGIMWDNKWRREMANKLECRLYEWERGVRKGIMPM
jgi:hypothetical protein